MILAFSQVRKEILKVAPLEVDQGDPLTGGLRVLMMHDLYVFFFFWKNEPWANAPRIQKDA